MSTTRDAAVKLAPAPAPQVPAFRLTDAGNAERFAHMHADRVRYVNGPDRWLVWDGMRWAYDVQKEVYRLAIATVRSIHADAADPALSKGQVNEITDHATKSERKERLEALLSLARAMPPLGIQPNDLDRDPDLLNVENGTVNLKTGELEPHDPADLITKLAAVNFDPSAVAPTWDAFLARVLPDADVRAYVQRVIGYSLTAHVKEHALFFAYGTGRNGKSVLLETVTSMVGEYGKPATHGVLLASRQDRHAAELADLMGARFVTAVEAEEGRAWDEAKVKWLTGGDKLSARWMHCNPFTFQPTHKFFVAGNHKPRVRGTDDGIWRRIHLIPFTVTIDENEVDRELPAKLRAELPGVLRWAVDGAVIWANYGLLPPPAVADATKAYRENEDLIGAFIKECCETGDDFRCVPSALHEEYRRWSGEIISVKKFGDTLVERGLERDRSNGRRWIKGIRLVRGEGE